MKHAWLYIFGVMLLGIIALGAGPAGALTGLGTYYAIPSWDQTLTCNIKAICLRFLILTNMSSQAVLDKETGLVWEQSPNLALYTWEEAQGRCNTLTTGGRLGWRLPTLQELESLIDPTRSGPALPAGHPFSNVMPVFYWSATTSASDTSHAWNVSFNKGIVETSFSKGEAVLVWCVRGGQGVDPQ